MEGRVVSTFPTLVLSATILFAHPTSEMEGVRLALKTWALAVLSQDIEGIAGTLHEEFLFNDRIAREPYLRGFESSLVLFPITGIHDQFAFFDHVGEDIQVTPVVTDNSLVKRSWKMIFRRTNAGWKMHRMAPGGEVPSQLLDESFPEQQLLHRGKIQLRDRATGRTVAPRGFTYEIRKRPTGRPTVIKRTSPVAGERMWAGMSLSGKRSSPMWNLISKRGWPQAGTRSRWSVAPSTNLGQSISKSPRLECPNLRSSLRAGPTSGNKAGSLEILMFTFWIPGRPFWRPGARI